MLGIPIWVLSILIAGTLVMGTLAYLLLDENIFLWAGEIEITSDATQEYITFEGMPITNTEGEFTLTEMDFPPGAGLTNGNNIPITKTFKSFTGDTFTIEFDLSYMPTGEIWTGVAISIFETGTTTPLSIITLDSGTIETFDINYFVDPLWLEPDPYETFPFDLRMYIEKVIFENYLPTGQYLCDDNAGITITDDLGFFDGTLESESWAVGQTGFGSCLDLSTITGTLPTEIFPFDELDDFSISLWVMKTGGEGVEFLGIGTVAGVPGFQAQINTANAVLFKIKDENGDGETWSTDDAVITTSLWHHIVYVFDGTTSECKEIWIDGTSETLTYTDDGFVSNMASSEPINLGRTLSCYLDMIIINTGMFTAEGVDYLYTNGQDI